MLYMTRIFFWVLKQSHRNPLQDCVEHDFEDFENNWQFFWTMILNQPIWDVPIAKPELFI